MTGLPALDFRDWQAVRRQRQARGRPFVIAHRGASAELPENTMAAFERGIQRGAHIIETDLWFTRDRQLALHHDRTLARTAGRPEAVGDLDLDVLTSVPTSMEGQYEAGAYTVPALRELLRLARTQSVGLLLELKDPRFSLPGYGQILIDELQAQDMMASCFLVSFAPACLMVMRNLSPELPIGLVSERFRAPTGPWDLIGPLYLNLLANPFYVPWAHRNRMLVAPLDPHPEKRAFLYAKMGVDALLTDDVARMASLLDAGRDEPAQTG